MIGYPYYDDSVVDDNRVYLSDVVMFNGKYFAYGFMLAVVSSSSLCFADDTIAISGSGNSVPAPSPSPEIPSGNAPTFARNSAQGLVAVAGCGAALKQCSSVAEQASKAAVDKLSSVSPPSMLAVGGCLLLAGFCAGKLTTAGIDKALGFK